MRGHYEITLEEGADGLWRAYHLIASPPFTTGTGATLRDALDELALQLERQRQEHDNAPH